MLEAERRGEINLTDEERRQYTKDRLAYETVNREMENDLSAQRNSEKYSTAKTEVENRLYQNQLDYMKKSGAVREAVQLNKPEEEIKQLQEIADEALRTQQNTSGELMVFDSINITNPEVLEAMGNAGEKAVDGLIAEHLPGADKIYDLKGQALEDALKPQNLFAEKSPFRMAGGPEQVPEVEINKEKVEEKEQPESGLNIG